MNDWSEPPMPEVEPVNFDSLTEREQAEVLAHLFGSNFAGRAIVNLLFGDGEGDAVPLV